MNIKYFSKRIYLVVNDFEKNYMFELRDEILQNDPMCVPFYVQTSSHIYILHIMYISREKGEGWCKTKI